MLPQEKQFLELITHFFLITKIVNGTKIQGGRGRTKITKNKISNSPRKIASHIVAITTVAVQSTGTSLPGI